MRTISRRLQRLEQGFGLGPRTEQLLMVVTAAGKRLALDQDRCIQILRESGFLPTGPVGLVNLGDIPDGLNAEELETFLREDGADICGLRSAQNQWWASRRSSAREPEAMKAITRRLCRLEESFGFQTQTEFDRRLRARIEAGRRRVTEARTREGYAEPALEDLSGLTVEEILLRGRLRAREAAAAALG